ncbi:MAG: SpoIIE family protein phosphatase [Negativicutes bacterium]|nr:SpoIIE family protein phosphatase [Negativicutes bacterium]
MIQLHPEVAVAQLSKCREELCGDKVEVTRSGELTTVVISDGLGSGVKANILATLTTKIASSLLKRGIPLEEVVNTVAQTLPVCRERKIAYSTLHIIKFRPDGQTTVVEFDSPATFLVRGGQVVPFPTKEKEIAGKTVMEGHLALQENDCIVAVSDGVIHSGIGGLLKLGWNWQGISAELTAMDPGKLSAAQIAAGILNCCNGYYLGQPGDDSTVVAVKLRRPRRLTLLTGPPADTAQDEAVVRRFLSEPGKKVVSGGTTANVVGRVTGKKVKVDLSYYDPLVPPTARIDGIDLVTEGVLTLAAASERFSDPTRLDNLSHQDGATLMVRLLLEADKICIYAGTAVNPAHQNPNFPTHINIKKQVLDNLQAKLEAAGKDVTVEWI